MPCWTTWSRKLPGPGPDPVLTRALDAAFGAAGRPSPKIRTLEPVSGGSINRAYRLVTEAGVFFCKWNPGGPEDMFEREREGLEALAGAGSGLRIPAVVALSPAGPSIPPVLVLEYLAPSASGTPDSAWEGLGRGLAALHRKGADGFGFARDNYCGLTLQENTWSRDWAAFYGDRRIGPLVRRLEKEGKLGARESTVFRKLRDRLPSLLAHGPGPSLLHGDLWCGNFLSSDQGPALVDPAAYFGDREAEWGMMLLFGGFPERVLAAYQEAWPLPDGWRGRSGLYQLYHLLNHFLLFGGGYGEQAMRIAARHL